MGFLNEFMNEQQQKRDAQFDIILERLSFLKAAAQQQIQFFKSSMETEFYKAQENKQHYSIIGRPFEFLAQYRINVRAGVNKQVEEAISGLFYFDKTNLISALQTMVVNSLNEIFITSSVGESQEEKFYIVPYNNAILRVDIRVWKYSFTNTGLFGNVENVFCFIVSKSILNLDLLSADELLYFVTQSLQGAPLEVVSDYIETLNKVRDAISKSKTNSKFVLKSEFGIDKHLQMNKMKTFSKNEPKKADWINSMKTLTENETEKAGWIKL